MSVISKVSVSGASIYETMEAMGDGDYRVVLIDLDVTETRVNEIIQLAALAQSTTTFNRLVMPFKNIRPLVAKNLGVRIDVIFGVLRSTRTGGELKSLSLFSALNEFLDWLSELKGASDGILLVHHDQQDENVAFHLAKALKIARMTDRFKDVVKGIINGAELFSPERIQTETDVEGSKGQGGSISIRALCAKGLNLDKGEIYLNLADARRRTDMTYNLYSKLLKSDRDITYNDIKTYFQQNKS